MIGQGDCRKRKPEPQTINSSFHSLFHYPYIASIQLLYNPNVDRYGFPASDAGVQQMLLALEEFREDVDVSVKQKLIQDIPQRVFIGFRVFP